MGKHEKNLNLFEFFEKKSFGFGMKSYDSDTIIEPWIQFLIPPQIPPQIFIPSSIPIFNLVNALHRHVSNSLKTIRLVWTAFN